MHLLSFFVIRGAMNVYLAAAVLSSCYPLHKYTAENKLGLIFQMHSKGQRHHAALSWLKAKELHKQVEINKRVALSDQPTTSALPSNRNQRSRLASKPLIEQTRKATSEILHPANAAQSIHQSHGLKCSMKTVSVHHAAGLNCEVNSHHSAQTNLLPSPQIDFRERQEIELKFTSAGWKRDCHGKWYRDENVSFNSVFICIRSCFA